MGGVAGVPGPRHDGGTYLRGIQMRRIITLSWVASAAVLLAACGGASAEAEAAQELADACIEDPEKTTIVVDGGTVRQELSDADQRAFNAATNQEINEETIEEAVEDQGSGLAIAFNLLLDGDCLAEEANVPTDADGEVVPGEYPGWDVSIDETGYVFVAVVD